MLDRISQKAKDQIAFNPTSEIRFYIDPRRVEYAPISGTEAYYEHSVTDPAFGQYSLASSSSVYMAPFTMPMTFEAYFKPMIAYDISSDVEFCVFRSDGYDSARVCLCYYSGSDQIGLKAYTSTGGTSPSQVDVKLDKVYTSNEELRQWVRVTATISSNGISLYSDGGNAVSDATDISGHKGKVLFSPSNSSNIYINYAKIYYGLEASAAQIASNFKDVKNEHVFFSFQRVGLGQTRCDITDKVKSYSHESKDGYTAATAGLVLMNLNGEFSADQYAEFMPESYSYNGDVSERYLANNQVGVSFEYWAKKKSRIDCPLLAQYPMVETIQMPDSPNGSSYANDLFTTVDGWTCGSGEGVITAGQRLLFNTGVVAGNKIAIENTDSRPSVAGDLLRIKIRANRAFTMEAFYYPSGSPTSLGTFQVLKTWNTVTLQLTNASDGIRIESTANAQDGDALYIDYIYMGKGLYVSELDDTNGNYDLLPIATYPSPSGIAFDGANAYAMTPISPARDVYSLTCTHTAIAFDSTACPVSTLYYDTSDSFGFGFSFVDATTVRIHYGQGASSSAASEDVTVSSYSLGVQYRWAVTYNTVDTYFRVYRNGSLVGTSAACATFDPESSVVCIGNYPYMDYTLITSSEYDYIVFNDGSFWRMA